MSEGPAVSVIVPFFDSEATIERCLRSLLDQRDSGPVEILFVDNGSRDSSAEIVAHHPQVTLLTETKPGAYAARNAAVAVARAPLLAFTDADCEVAPDWVRSLRRALADPATAIVVGDCRYPARASPALKLLAVYENAKTAFVVAHGSPAQQFAHANNMGVRAEVFEQLGPFVEWRRAADSELVHRMAAQRPEWRLGFDASMRVTHLEFSSFTHRLKRLRLYRQTNSQMEDFEELRLGQRIRALLRWRRDR